MEKSNKEWKKAVKNGKKKQRIKKDSKKWKKQQEIEKSDGKSNSIGETE